MDPKPDLIGLGRVGCVMRIGDIAVKTANKWTVPDNASEYTTILYEQANMSNEEALAQEGRIYQRLQSVEGVLKPLHISNTEIQMPYISHRSLDHHLSATNVIVDHEQRLAWFRNAADIVYRVHLQRVVIPDITAPNFLVNKDLSLQLCDFSESFVIPEDRALDDYVSDDFLSVKFDIARFGSMMYEILSGSRYEFYVAPDIDVALDDGPSKTYKEWPTGEKFPDTSNLFLGDIILKCWLQGGFRSMKDVHNALQSTRTSRKGFEVNFNWRRVFRMASPIVTAIIFTAIISHLSWRRFMGALSFRR